MKQANRLTACILMLISGILFYFAKNIRVVSHTIYSSQDFPKIILGVVFCLSVFLFLQTFYKKGEWEKVDWRSLIGIKRLILFGLLTTYFLLMPIIGFLVASGGFIVATTLALSPRRKKDFPISLAVAGGMVSIIYIVFVYWLQVVLP